MTSYRRDPIDRALCGWGDCRDVASGLAPLCMNHLIAAWGIVQEYNHTLMEVARQQGNEPEPAEPASMVYYYRSNRGIKIGRTVNLEDRMRTLMVSMDDVLACEPGDHRKETMRHRQFRFLRIPRTEFFHEAPELLAHVAEIRAAFGDPRALGEALQRFRARRLDRV